MGEVHEEGGVSFSEITTLCFRNTLRLFPKEMSGCGKEMSNERAQLSKQRPGFARLRTMHNAAAGLQMSGTKT
jgi:hypothetical protein